MSKKPCPPPPGVAKYSYFDIIPLPSKNATAEEKDAFWQKIKERTDEWDAEQRAVTKANRENSNAAKPASCGAEESKIVWGDVRCLSTRGRQTGK